MQKEVSEYARKYVDKVDPLKNEVSVHTLTHSGLNLSRQDSNKIQVILQPVRAKLYSSLERSPERNTAAQYYSGIRKIGTSQEIRAHVKQARKNKPFFSRRSQQRSRPKVNVKAVIDSNANSQENMLEGNYDNDMMTQTNDRLPSCRASS